MCIIVDGVTDFQLEVGEKVEEIKPTSIPVDHAKVPDNLKRRNLWVVWAYVRKDGRWTKMPFQAVRSSQKYRVKTGWVLFAAKSNNPDTWSDYETVATFHERHPTLTDGIGVMLQEGLLGDDLDKCRDKVTGEVSEWALDLVRRGDCYTEVSQSGTGLKMFMMADLEAVRSLPEFAGQKSLRKQAPYGTGRVEVYDKSSNRFFTVTGHRFGDVTTIEDRQEQFNDVYRTVFASIGKTKHEDVPRREFAESPNGAVKPDWLRQLCADEAPKRSTSWLKQFKGDLRTLDVMGLWRSAGLIIDQKDDEKFAVQCPNRANHSDPEAFGGTVLYKRPGGYPIFHCGRTKCRDGQFGTREALLSFGPELVDQFCEPFRPNGGDDGDHPEIITSNRQLPDLTMDAMKAIEKANDPPRLFRRSGAVVRLRRDDGPVYCEPLSVPALRGEIARAAVWKRWAGSGDKAVKINDKPPREVVQDLLSHPGWRLPVIEQIVESPVFTADGRLIDQPGYDPDCRLWYEPAPGLDRVHVPLHPTGEQVADALRLLNNMLGDFPFVDDADRANCPAFCLLPAVRQMIIGNTPMHVFGASKQGTGKGRLVDLWGLIWLRRTPSLTSEPHSDKEWGEKIGSSLMSEAGYFFVDNIKYAVKSGALAVALTTSRFSYRILGESKVVDLPVRWCWGATANNIKADSDIVRRFIRTRLDANCERPELRKGWKIPDLLGWARDRRSELVSAYLTIVLGWIDAGKPMGDYTLGSYEEWARVMGGILDFIGVPGFLGNLSSNDEVNSTEAEWRGFVNLWWAFLRDKEVTIRELYELAMEGDVLSGVMGDGRDMSQRTKLGLALGNREGQVWSGKKIVIPKDESGRRRVHRKGSVLYHLIDIGEDPTGPRPLTQIESPQSDVEVEQRTPPPNNPVPSMNGQRYRIGDWVQTTLVPEAVRVLAWGNHPDEYVLGFMDEREFSMPLGNREFRISNRPRVTVQTAEILGVAETP